MLRIGLIATTGADRERLTALLAERGVAVALARAPDALAAADIASRAVSAWLVHLAEDDWTEAVDALLEQDVTPVFYDDPATLAQHAFPSYWARQVGERLREIARIAGTLVEDAAPVESGSPELPEDLDFSLAEMALDSDLELSAGLDESPLSLAESGQPAPLEDLDLALPEELALDLVDAPELNEDFAWDLTTEAGRPELVVDNAAAPEAPVLRVVVLAASLGGPAAVKRFLQALPPGLPAVFVLAQHIDPGFLPVLARALETVSPYQVTMVEGSHTLEAGQLILVPVASRLNFAAGRLITTSPAHWTPPYAPCINDVMADVARVYGPEALAIVFSGMSDDGALGARVMSEHGAETWAQDAESCANSSMPDSARATGQVSYTGTPEELAEHCALRLGSARAATAVNH